MTDQFPMPSLGFQRSLSSFQASPEIDATAPDWLQMFLALEKAFRTLSQLEMLPVMFDQSQPFDAAFLFWCVEAERRENQPTEHFLSRPGAPMPSPQFQRGLVAFQSTIKKRMQKPQIREFLSMAGALILAYRTLSEAGVIQMMFDPDTSFDTAMLVWCVEAEQRSLRRTPQNTLDLSRN